MGFFIMKLFLILSKKNLAIILTVTVISLLLLSQVFSTNSKKADGSTNKLRTDYLKSIGISADDSDVYSKNIIIPETFDDVYSQYNSLQKKAGFDLAPFKGKDATVYTYSISGDLKNQVHLIVCDGFIIGGDVSSVKLDGEMKPLK